MKFLYFSFLFVSLFSSAVNRQISKLSDFDLDYKLQKQEFPNLIKDSDEMGRAFLERDFERFSEFMHPKVIAMAGGTEKFRAILEKADAEIKANGLRFIKYEVGAPLQILTEEKEFFAILPTNIEMKDDNQPNISLKDKGGLLAVSNNQGTNWKFVRIQSKSGLKMLFPKIFDKLKFPEGIE